MRKIAAALATTALAATVLGPISAAGAQVIDEVQQISCDTVAPVLDPVVCDATSSLAPVEDAVAEVLAPVAPLLGEVQSATGPAPAPAPAITPAPATEERAAPGPAPSPSSSPAPSSTVGSTSSSAPTGFGGSVSVSGGGARSSSGRVPSVPVGSSLHLGSLGMPVFEVVTPAATAKAAERAVSNVVLPAATAAAAAEAMPQGGYAVAVLAAISALLLAAGLHLDHRRKTHHVIPA